MTDMVYDIFSNKSYSESKIFVGMGRVRYAIFEVLSSYFQHKSGSGGGNYSAILYTQNLSSKWLTKLMLSPI